jgi:beta-galactosidase
MSSRQLDRTGRSYQVSRRTCHTAAAVSSPLPVSFDPRSLLVGGKRELVISGEIHYARSPREQWGALLDRSVECGLNCVASYVFWNWHEPRRDVYDFSGDRDVGHFLQLCAQRKLHVILRAGPYCCAEWNYGGFPPYLRDEEGITIRTFSKPYLDRVEKYFRHLADEVRPYLASHGGPVILVQVENEYNNVAGRYGEEGEKYIQWLRDLAIEVGFDVPLIMCEGGVEGTIETVNGFSITDGIVAKFRERHPALPMIWTELWPGWCDTWGYQRHLRDASNIAFHLLRFVAAGGSGVNYYMWHAGTNLARTSMYLQATAYGVDAPLDEFGRATEKARYLAKLHAILRDRAGLLLAGERSVQTPQPGVTRARWQKARQGLDLLINANTQTVTCDGITLAPQSALLRDGAGTKLFETVADLQATRRSFRIPAWRALPMTFDWQRWDEPLPQSREGGVASDQPLEQLSLTNDTSDYCWYSSTIVLTKSGRHVIEMPYAADYLYLFLGEKLIGASEVPLLENRGRPLPLAGTAKPGDVNALESQSSHYRHSFAFEAAAGEYRLDCLATALGLVKGDWQVSGPMNIERRGIWAGVRLDGKLLHRWRMVPGLAGEQLNLARVPQSVAWRPAAGRRPLRWYQARFSLSPRMLKADVDVRLDAMGLGKGMLFVNGYGLGRHWLIPGQGYGGDEGWQDQQLNGLHLAPAGEPTQRYYRVPQGWLRSSNTLVVFEETAAIPTAIRLQTRRF